MRLDDSHVAILIGCNHPIHGEECTVRELNHRGAAGFNYVVVRHDPAIFAYQEAAALGDWMPFLVRHDD